MRERVIYKGQRWYLVEKSDLAGLAVIESIYDSTNVLIVGISMIKRVK